MDEYIKIINRSEKSKRVAVTRKYPSLLPLILNTKQFVNIFRYTYHPKFRVSKKVTSKWFNLVDHSSPLYRKFNKIELDEGKIINIKTAIKELDGLVIAPGQTFSFWKFVGKPTKERGFENGLVLSAGQLQEDIGGGLCQLSNLLAYMFACTECDFIERKHHSKDVFPDSGRTVPFASGATVFFNLIDLKVKNTYSFPIKINLRVTDTQLRGSISGPESLQYVIKLEELNSQFIKSARTGIVYRCNQIQRAFFSKNTKVRIKHVPLWRNVAEVMYSESEIRYPISIV